MKMLDDLQKERELKERKKYVLFLCMQKDEAVDREAVVQIQSSLTVSYGNCRLFHEFYWAVTIVSMVVYEYYRNKAG